MNWAESGGIISAAQLQKHLKTQLQTWQLLLITIAHFYRPLLPYFITVIYVFSLKVKNAKHEPGHVTKWPFSSKQVQTELCWLSKILSLSFFCFSNGSVKFSDSMVQLIFARHSFKLQSFIFNKVRQQSAGRPAKNRD